MRKQILTCLTLRLLLFCLVATWVRPSAAQDEKPAAGAQGASAPAALDARFLRHALHETRLTFVQRAEQTQPGPRFVANGPGFQLSLERDGLSLFTFRPASVASAADGKQSGARGAPPFGATKVALPLVTETTRIRFSDANPAVEIEGLDAGTEKVNSFIGSDPAKWSHALTVYRQVRYRNLYPGIDLVFYGRKDRQLEYDLVVSPGADPAVIRLTVDGDRAVFIDAGGDLRLDGEAGPVLLRKPMLYQDIRNGKRVIGGAFIQAARSAFGFKAADYDRSRPLIIDPAFNLLYSTYVGGIHEDSAGSVALDAQNNIYVTGITASQDFPVSANAFGPQLVKPYIYELNTFVMKFDSAGTLLFSTFLGGSGANGNLSDQAHPGDEPARGIGIDAAGNIFLAGTTTSTDFPVTPNAYQTTIAGSQNGYLAELSPDGSRLEYGSYYGGASLMNVGAMALAKNGQIYIAGSSGPGLPTTSGAYKATLAPAPQGQSAPYEAAFVAVFDSSKTGVGQLVAATYYGTDSPQPNTLVTGNLGYMMALDSKGDPWLVGQTYTSNLPTTANAIQAAVPALSTDCAGGGSPLNSAGYIAEFTPVLTALQYATYLSGKSASPTAGPDCSEYINGIAIDGADNVYVDGATASSSFPTTTGALQAASPNPTSYTEFFAKLNTGGASLAWASYLGGSGGNTFSGALVADAQQNVWLVGVTDGGSNFPISSNAYQATEPAGSSFTGFIDEVSADGSKLLYGTYLGGNQGVAVLSVVLDAAGNVYTVGSASDTSFPVTADAIQPKFANGDQGPDSTDAFLSILGSGAIGIITPAVGGNTGDTTITVDGAGFQSGATCSIVSGSTTIASIAATVNSNGTAITCTFALNGAAPGSYNVVITNPGGSSFTKTSGFTIEGGGQPVIWTTITGRPIIRTGSPSTFDISIGNSGTTDAYFVLLWVGFASELQYDLPGKITEVNTGADYTQANATVATDGLTYLPFLITKLPALKSFSFPIRFTSSADEPTLPYVVFTRAPWFDSAAAAQTELSAARGNAASVPTSCQPVTGKPYLSDCFGFTINQVVQQVTAVSAPEQGTPTPNPTPPSSISPISTQQQTAIGNSLIDSLTRAFNVTQGTAPPIAATALAERETSPRPDSNPVNNAVLAVLGGVGLAAEGVVAAVTSLGIAVYNTGTAGWNEPAGCVLTGSVPVYSQPCQNGVAFTLYSQVWTPNPPGGTCYPTFYWSLKSCDPQHPAPPPACKAPSAKFVGSRLNLPARSFSSSGSGSSSSGCSGSGGAIDPNYKSGSAGDSSANRYVRPITPIQYSVGFENEPNAALPAATVVVTDQLDPTKVDLSTISLGNINFGSNSITLPSGTNDYSTTYTPNGVTSYAVRIQGSLDPTTGLLKWTFQTIDPATGLPPTDSTVGFLPPDTDGIKGQGSVLFNVMPKAGQATGTQITNSATVVFDANAPINTQTWLNTLDVDPPASKVTALPANEATGSFTVAWSGTDVGSGIASYTVFASDNGATFVPWQSGVATTSAAFAGVAGHTYAFYSIATDGAGNIEPAKSAAEATTRVVGVATSTALQSSASQVNVGASVTLTATVAPASGSAIPTGTIIFQSGSTALGTQSLSAAGSAQLATTSLPAGTDSITAVYSGDATFTASTSTAVSVTVVQPTPGFALTETPASLTVNAGSTASTTLTVTPANGFNLAVSFACTGLPSKSSCTFSPASVTPGTAAVTSTLTISTTATTTTSSKNILPLHGPAGAAPILAAAGFFGWIFSLRRWRRQALRIFPVVTLLAVVALLSSCGGGGHSTQTIPGTPAGSYTVTVTGASGSGNSQLSHSTTITLTVQ